MRVKNNRKNQKLKVKAQLRYRHEEKYILDAKQDGILKVRADGVLQRDSNTGENQFYTVRSLYFDDFQNSCLWDNIQDGDPRAKFRIRYYNSDTEYIVLEKKTRIHRLGRKEICRISREECETLMKGASPIILPDMEELKKRLFLELQLRNLYPKMIITYEREPFVYSGGNVRITFDRFITSSPETEKFLSGDYMQRPILANGDSIMEVKWDELLPLHIKEIFRIGRLQKTAFSKYYMCRKYHL